MQYHNISGIDVPASPYSHVVEADGLVCLAGQVAADSASGREVLGNIAAETRAVMEQIRLCLQDRQLGFDDVIRVEIYLTDLGDFRIVDAIYGQYFSKGRYPARTCVEVRRLFGNSRIEITMMAKRS